MDSPEKREPFEGKAFVDEVPPNRFIKFLSRFLQIETDRENPQEYPGFKPVRNDHPASDTD